MELSCVCALCDQAQDAEGRDVASCSHCGQRFSVDSSRSTRGGSEVPILRIDSLTERATLHMPDSKGVIQAVGSKVKAVFGKGTENKKPEPAKPAS